MTTSWSVTTRAWWPWATDGNACPIPGIEYALPAVSFLREANLARHSLTGKKVGILGGGVAFDCAFTTRRLGAMQTSLVCLESRGAMRVPEIEMR